MEVVKIDKIILFNKNTNKSDLINNIGATVIDEFCSNGIIIPALDGSNICTVELINDTCMNIVNTLENGMIIKALRNGAYDYFTVVDIVSNLDYTTINCRHWTTETTRAMFIMDIKPRDEQVYSIVDRLKTESVEYGSGLQYAKDLEISSNITSQASLNIYETSVYEGLRELQESVGGEIEREGFSVKLQNRVGSTNVKYIVEYSKNMLTQEIDDSAENIRAILPKGFNGIGNKILILSQEVQGITKRVEYPVRLSESDREQEEGYEYFDTNEECQARLIELCSQEITQGRFSKDKVYNVSFLDLYTVGEDVEKSNISVGDLVKVKNIKNNLDVNVRVQEIQFDILAQENLNVVLCDKNIGEILPPTIGSVNDKVDKLPSVNEVLDKAWQDSKDLVNAGFGGFCHYRPNYTAWTNTKDIAKAETGLCANMNGWFFFKKGIDSNTGVPNADGATMIADINGAFNADVINTGTLNANLVRAGIIKGFNDNLIINLDNGEVNFKKGLIQGTNSSWNLNDGKVNFTGGTIGKDNLILNLDTGEVSFKKGLIQGQNSSWNLNTGKVNFTGGTIGNENLTLNLDTGEVSFKKGLISGLNSSWDLNTGVFRSEKYNNGTLITDIEVSGGQLKSSKKVGIRGLDGGYIGYYPNGYEQLAGAIMSVGNSYNGGSGASIVADEISLRGAVFINDVPISSRIMNIENAMLSQEGLI